MTYLDKAMYGQFYNKDMDCFIWNIKQCDFCGKTLYNSYYDHCDFCCVPEFEPKPCCPYDSDMSVFDIDLFKSWENKWLYGDC